MAKTQRDRLTPESRRSLWSPHQCTSNIAGDPLSIYILILSPFQLYLKYLLYKTVVCVPKFGPKGKPITLIALRENGWKGYHTARAPLSFMAPKWSGILMPWANCLVAYLRKWWPFHWVHVKILSNDFDAQSPLHKCNWFEQEMFHYLRVLRYKFVALQCNGILHCLFQFYSKFFVLWNCSWHQTGLLHVLSKLLGTFWKTVALPLSTRENSKQLQCAIPNSTAVRTR